jgi:hypothetical protein
MEQALECPIMFLEPVAAPSTAAQRITTGSRRGGGDGSFAEFFFRRAAEMPKGS